MSNKVENKETNEEGVSNGDTKKSFGKFRFSLGSKNTSTQPKPESTKNAEEQKPDPASLLASLKAEKTSNRSDDDTSNDATVSLKPIKPIKMKLVTGAPKVAGIKRPAQEAKKIDLAEVFNPDEQPEEEEMPPEAKMRMRNIGKDTPTASGPNSFNKGKLGFCNQAKMLEKQMKLAFENAERSKKKY